MAGRKSDFTLTKLDDLFTTQAQRDEEQLSKIRDIPLELIDDFPDHPFKVRDDEDMMQLVESVKERGVITPATVRQKEDGRYELVSGHRRKRACELAGFETLRSEIVDLNRDEATILMVESNFQRSEILPSEKAFAYKMRLEAMKRQAGRPSKENASPVGIDLRGKQSLDLMSEECGDSRNQIHRYVRLTNLVPELLEFVDEGRIKMRPAVELSYLDEDCQRDVVDEIDLNDATPSHDQTIRMRKLFNEGNLTTEAIHAVMSEEKPNQNKSFWEGHKMITFDTLTDSHQYEVIAVFKTVVYTNSSDSFKYYEFTDAENAAEFDAYVAKCKELSLYDTGVSAEYGDKLISLSTCEYSRNNGRLVVVAKRVD